MQSAVKGYLILFCLILGAYSSANMPWKKQAKYNQGLPSSVQIYTLKTNNSIFGTNLTGAFALFDFTDTNLQFKVAHTQDQISHTPMQWAERQENVVYAVLNGGFFNVQLNQSASFICSQGKVFHSNTLNKVPKSNIYPTLGSIGVLKSNNKFDIQYTYSFDKQNLTYVFPKPNKYPGPEPIRSDGMYWNLKEGIGAGPIVLKNYQSPQGNAENFNDYIMTMRHPRSAICYDQYDRLIMLAIDGRYEGSVGLTIAELTLVMKDIGCKDALNLDGGGSTLLYANNFVLSHYSDPVPRPVVSAIVIRDKHKKKLRKRQNLMTQ